MDLPHPGDPFILAGSIHLAGDIVNDHAGKVGGQKEMREWGTWGCKNEEMENVL